MPTTRPLLLVLLALAACHSTSPEEAFRQRVLHRLATKQLATGEALSVSEPLRLALRHPGSTSREMSLEPAFRTCATDASACEGAIDAAFDELSGSPPPPPPHTLLPELANDDDLVRAMARARVMSARAGEAILIFQFSVFDEVLVESGGRRRGPLRRADLIVMGLDEKVAEAQARAALRAAAPPISGVPTGTGAFEVLSRGAIPASSLLLVLDAWEPLARGKSDGLLACAPTRNRVLYADATRVSIDRMRTICGEAFEHGGDRVSPSVVRWTATDWMPADVTP